MKPSSTLLRTLPQPRTSALVLVLFVLLQTATLLHAETHAFHDHTELCSVFHKFEHQPVVAGAADAATKYTLLADEPAPLHRAQFSQPVGTGFHARGPPRHISKTHS